MRKEMRQERRRCNQDRRNDERFGDAADLHSVPPMTTKQPTGRALSEI